tara:strand:- start:3560 stop:4567 length:1008 start_codon:yes stop_codon:yes gene_type:complete
VTDVSGHGAASSSLEKETNMFDAGTPVAPSPTRTRLCVLHNPGSGKQDSDSMSDQLIESFARHGLTPEIVRLQPGRDLSAAVRKALDDGYGTVIAAGGDGTICGVAEALNGTSCRMGILPRGTFNYFARSLGIPEDLDGAVDVIAAGHSKLLRVATLNGKVFLNNANFGLYPEILRSREEIYDFWGRSRAAAYWSALKVLFRWPRPLEMEIRADGCITTVRTPLVFVFNNAFQLKQMGMEGAECIEKGQLALMVAPDSGRMGMIRSSLAVLARRASRERDFDLICSDAIELRVKRKKLLVARDGERTHMKGPFHLALSDTPLEVVVPGEFGDATR